MQILFGIGATIIIVSLIFRSSFIAELILSFLPFLFLICGICTLLLCISLIRNKEKRKKIWTIIEIGIFIIISGILGSEYFNFYHQGSASSLTEWIKIVYANILYTNTEFEALKEKILQENPDIVMLVEFSRQHEKEMKDFFQERYPYVNRNSRSEDLAGNIIFSKYPLENLTEQYPTPLGSRRYSYVQIQPDSQKSPIELYLIHTAAPVSLKNFHMRNKQLEKLTTEFQQQELDRGTQRQAILIGDFNLTPWSFYYKQLISQLPPRVKNSLQFQAPTTTRSLEGQGIFKAHIDHLFTTDGITVSPVKIEDLLGSDHNIFTFTFQN